MMYDQAMRLFEAVLGEFNAHRATGNTTAIAAGAVLARRLGLDGAVIVVSQAAHARTVAQLYPKLVQVLGIDTPQRWPDVVPLQLLEGGALRGRNRGAAVLFDGDCIRSLVQLAHDELRDALVDIKRLETALQMAQGAAQGAAQRARSAEHRAQHLEAVQRAAATLVQALEHDPQSDTAREAFAQLKAALAP